MSSSSNRPPIIRAPPRPHRSPNPHNRPFLHFASVPAQPPPPLVLRSGPPVAQHHDSGTTYEICEPNTVMSPPSLSVSTCPPTRRYLEHSNGRINASNTITHIDQGASSFNHGSTVLTPFQRDGALRSGAHQQQPFQDEYYQNAETANYQQYPENNSYPPPLPSQKQSSHQGTQQYSQHFQQSVENQRQRRSSSVSPNDVPLKLNGTSPAPSIAFDSMKSHDAHSRRSQSLSGDGLTKQYATRGRFIPQTFHSLYLKRILPIGLTQSGQIQKSQLHIEFLSHLQGIILDIIPGSQFRLHGGMTSNIQVRAAPIELSWDLPHSHGHHDPLRALFNVLKRQQPTPLKYLFRCPNNVPMFGVLRHLLVSDLVSQMSCQVTLNNNWSVIFSSLLYCYTSIHPVIQIATQSIVHWGIKSGFNIMPPVVVPHYDATPSSITSYSKAEGHPPSTHTNLSVLLILWVRYLIDRFQLATVSELLLDNPGLPSITLNETVEQILLQFFDFYRTVDFSTSIISIKSGSPPLNRVETVMPPILSGIVIVDPIVERNLAATWQPTQVANLIKELQVSPWALELLSASQQTNSDFNEDQQIIDLVSPLYKDSMLLSQWLIVLMDSSFPSTSTQQYELFDHADLSLRVKSPNTTLTAITNGYDKDKSTFPSRTDLVAELDAFRICQQVLAEKVRFLRNEVWWLERKTPGVTPRRERTDSSFSVPIRLQSINEEAHWTSRHFGVASSSSSCSITHNNSSSVTNLDGIQHQAFSALGIQGQFDSSKSGICTGSNFRNSFDYKSSLPGSPLPDSEGLTTTTGSTPPLSNESPSTTHNPNHQSNTTMERLNDTVAMLLELAGYPRELFPVDYSPRSSSDDKNKDDNDKDKDKDRTPHCASLDNLPSCGTTIHNTSSEYLLALVEKHFGGNANAHQNSNWDKSPQLQMLVQDLLRDSGYIKKRLHPEAYKVSSPVPSSFAIIPFFNQTVIQFSLSWNGKDAPRVGTLRNKIFLGRSPSSFASSETPTDINVSDPSSADMSYCDGHQSSLLHFELNTTSGRLSALDDDQGDEMHVLLPPHNVDNNSINENKIVPMIRTPESSRYTSELIVIIWKKQTNRI